MLKKILAALSAAVIAVSMAGCSYEMTEEDLELQKSMIGFWAADNSTGYNEFDENGNLTLMVAVQFTEDYKYLVYHCLLDQGQVLTYMPISYTIEDEKFKVDQNGVASYAGVSISADGRTMSWITDEKTDKYIRFTAEEADNIGIPEYYPGKYEEMFAEDEDGEENPGAGDFDEHDHIHDADEHDHEHDADEHDHTHGGDEHTHADDPEESDTEGSSEE